MADPAGAPSPVVVTVPAISQKAGSGGAADLSTAAVIVTCGTPSAVSPATEQVPAAIAAGAPIIMPPVSRAKAASRPVSRNTIAFLRGLNFCVVVAGEEKSRRPAEAPAGHCAFLPQLVSYATFAATLPGTRIRVNPNLVSLGAA